MRSLHIKKSYKLARIVFIICLTLYLGDTIAQIVVHDQRYQVDNMPQPQSFTFLNNIPIQNETLEMSGTNSSYKHTYHRLYGTPIPIANNENMIISLGFGYATDQIESPTPLVKGGNEAMWAQLYSTGSIGEDYFWRSALAAGSYSNGIRIKNSDTYKYTGLVQFGKKWNPNLATSIGVLLLSNFGDIQVVPIAQISYSKGDFVFDFWIPVDVNVRYIKNENLHFLFQNTIGSRSYSNDAHTWKYSINEISFRSEIRLLGVLWIEMALVKPYSLKMEIQNEDQYSEIGSKLTQSLSLQVGLFVRFEDR